MKTVFFSMAFVLLSALAASSSFGAYTEVYAAGANHIMRTNTGGGSCVSVELEDSSYNTSCHDGNIWVLLNDTVGCLSTQGGSGQCIAGDLPANAYNTETVRCPNGRTWEISNGNGEPNSHCGTTVNENGVTGGHCGNGPVGEETNKVTINCECGSDGCCEDMTGASTCICKNCN